MDASDVLTLQGFAPMLAALAEITMTTRPTEKSSQHFTFLHEYLYLNSRGDRYAIVPVDCPPAERRKASPSHQ
jgi:hypothetical protein